MGKKPSDPPTSDVAWALSAASYENAQRLVDSAALLHAAGHYRPALSLAISAREELGKFLIAILVGVGLAPPQRLLEVRWDHKPKQAVGVAVSRAASVINFGVSPFAEAVDLRGIKPEDILAVVNERLATAAQNIELAEGALDDVVAASEAAATGADDRVRQRGLYVDLVESPDGWRVLSPSDVSGEAAQREIDDARRFFEFGKSMSNLVQADPETLDAPPPSEEVMRTMLTDFKGCGVSLQVGAVRPNNFAASSDLAGGKLQTGHDGPLRRRKPIIRDS